jgi:segregation and condensation protein B
MTIPDDNSEGAGMGGDMEAQPGDMAQPDEMDAQPDDLVQPREIESEGLIRDIEAVLFISPEPVSLEVLAEVTACEGEELARAVEAVRDQRAEGKSGIVFTEVAGGYTFRTADSALAAVERFCARPVDYSLSAAAMESLAIIAYLQPITRPEIARIRGVGADTVVANMLDKGLVEEAGREGKTGAIRYRTTPAFEKLFGLTGLEQLPSLDGFEATAEDVEELRQKLYLAAEKRNTGAAY